ncbi:hypothetical protein [Streptomyces sp. NPDC051546]|uniref:hypothetical protein n=1 Tax=Streptomyces sp. NPDC051546 TaxID=3365655 RepID=UPI0037B1400D
MPSSEDRARWGQISLDAYLEAGGTNLSYRPRADRIRLGIAAAEAMARETRDRPWEAVVDSEEASAEIIGDAISYVFFLTADQAAPSVVIEAANQARAGNQDDSAGAATNAARMLADLMEAADFFGSDAEYLVLDGRAFHEECMAGMWD